MGKKNKNNSVLNPPIRYEGDKVYVVPETAKDYFITYYDTPDGMWRSFNSDVNGAVDEANNIYKSIARGDTAYKPLNISPEVTITGYKPIRLKTFYPLHKGYPLTGHSVLKIPITSKVMLEYTEEERPIELVVDKQSNAKDYNLVTNNCADTTLKYLNYIFGTDERTNFFTTPGDVRDFAINKLNGKVITDKHGNDTVIIPRTKENADKLSEKALLLYEKEPDRKTVRWHYLKLGGKIRKMQNASGGPLYPWTPTVVNPAVQEWASKENTNWRLTPASRSNVFGGATKSINRNKKPESSEEYTKRRVKEETKRTWRSDVADILHGIGEAALSVHPYTAIPYFGAKVLLDLLSGNYGWWTALNASIPLFHISPQAVGLREATNVALEDAANLGSKTARNWRVAREINLATRNKPNLSNRTYTENNGNYILFSPFGEDIGTLLTTKPLTSEMKGKGISMVASKNGGKGVSEDLYNVAVGDAKLQGYPGLESGHDLFIPELTMHVTDKFPKIEIPNVSLLNINGKWEFAPDPILPPIRLLIGTSERPLPNFIQELTNHRIDLRALENLLSIKFNEATGNFEEIPIKRNTNEPPISLKFFERPSRILPLQTVPTVKPSDIPENSAEKEYVDALLNGTKPMFVLPIEGAGANADRLYIDRLLKNNYRTFDLNRMVAGGTPQTLRYYINEDKFKLTIDTYKKLYQSRLGLSPNSTTDDIFNYLMDHPELFNVSIAPGSPGLLDIIGLSLGYGIKDAILFKLGANGLYVGDIIPLHFLLSLKTYEYDKLVPGIYNILKKNIERGTLVGKYVEHNGPHIGFGYSRPQITAENAANITSEQWTAALDAAIAKALGISPEEAASLTKEQYEVAIANGADMSEVLRLRDLHFKVTSQTKILDENGNVLPSFHYSENKFTAFDPNKIGVNDPGFYGKGFYSAPDRKYASTYGENEYKLYINSKNPFRTNNSEDRSLAAFSFNRTNESPIIDIDNLNLRKELEEADAVWQKGVAPVRGDKPIEEIVVANPSQMKLADAVTFDPKTGRRIPLGKRDNFNKNNTLWGLLPFGIGLTGYGLYNKNEKVK